MYLLGNSNLSKTSTLIRKRILFIDKQKYTIINFRFSSLYHKPLQNISKSRQSDFINIIVKIIVKTFNKYRKNPTNIDIK